MNDSLSVFLGETLVGELSAQVLGIYPHEKRKYEGKYERLALLSQKICSPGAGLEIVRRLAFMLACGNGDAHWKNWSLLYRDGVSASLTPLYDYVCTIAYPELSREMALKINGHNKFDAITDDAIIRLSRKAGLIEDEALSTFHETLRLSSQTLSSVREEMPPPIYNAIIAFWSQIPILARLL